MALPDQIASGSFPVAPLSDTRPIFHSDDYTYIVYDSDGGSTITVYRNDIPGTNSWTSRNTWSPSSANISSAECYATWYDGTYIHIVAQDNGYFIVNSLNLNTNTWSGQGTEYSCGTSPTGEYNQISMCIATDGDMYVMYQHETTDKGKDYCGVYYRRSTDSGQTFGADTTIVAESTSDNISLQRIRPGDSGRVQAFYSRWNDRKIYVKSITDGTVSTERVILSSNVTTTNQYNETRLVAECVSYDDNGTTKWLVAYATANSTAWYVGITTATEQSSASAWTWTDLGEVSDTWPNTTTGNDEFSVFFGAAANTLNGSPDLWYAYINAAGSTLYTSTNTGSGWAADNAQQTGLSTVEGVVGITVGERSGNAILGIMFADDDANGLWYDEIDLGTISTPSLAKDIQTRNRKILAHPRPISGLLR